MLKFIKLVFTVLLSFSRSLARAVRVSHTTKCISRNSKSCLAVPTYIDSNLNELHYYPFMASLGR